MTFQSRRTVSKPRKSHRCGHCASFIPVGVSHVLETGVWDGDFYVLRAHHDCADMWANIYPDYADPWEGMPNDLCEAIFPEDVQSVYDHYRGHYPHVICRLELRWQRGDLAQRERYRKLGFDPDMSGCPEIYG